MSDAQDRSSLSLIANRMREEWDRRVSHDYRYWMSDGVEDDTRMWETGARDFEMLIRGLEPEALREQVSLEIGCGVGRLLRPAARYFRRAIGLDVSQEAIREAERLLADLPNVELVLGNGINLSSIATGSVDFAFTFAALSSMPVSVIANYLAELARVVRPGGVMRLQVYLGKEQDTYEEDTIAIRSFSEERFVAAISRAGFTVEFVEEFSLPFEVSNKEDGLIAKIVGLRRSNIQGGMPSEVKEELLPSGERSAGDLWQGSETEYLMALARARQHMDAGQAQEALDALEFAAAYYSQPDPEVVELLTDLRKVVKASRGADEPAASPVQDSGSGNNAASRVPAHPADLGGLAGQFNSELYAQNIKVVRERFPNLVEQIERTRITDSVEVLSSLSGKGVLSYRQMPLSHREKPERAGEVWSERTLQSPVVKSKETLIVAGFADGYHLRALAQSTDKQLHVIEPRPEILRAALGIVDLREVLLRLSSLSVTVEEFRNVLRGLDAENAEFVIHPQTQAVSGVIVGEARRIFRSERGFGQLRPTIGVVGPMYGGSLPIARYTASALNQLKQRVLSYDLEEFYKGFIHLEDFLKKPDRRGIVESQYVEMLSQLVLEGVNERPVDILIFLAQAPMTPRVLTDLRNRGIITVMWFVEDCRRFLTWQQIAPYYDYMFLIQREEFPRLVEQAGAGRAIYLPVGCDPRIHRPLLLTPEEREHYGSELSFVGAGYNNRRHVFSTFSGRDLKIWGTEWPACLPFTKIVQDQGARVSVDDYVKVFNASSININLHSSHERDGVEPNGDFINPRTFELAAAGAFQLVDNRRLLSENFVPGEEVVTFSDEKDLLDKCDYYLAHPEERETIAAAGRRRALAEHTYENRLKTMLEYIYADRYEELEAKIEQGPWLKTLKAAEPHKELSNRLKAVYDRGDEPKLDSLVGDIQTGKGTLTETEQLLLFLHHVRGQISYVRKLRKDGQ